MDEYGSTMLPRSSRLLSLIQCRRVPIVEQLTRGGVAELSPRGDTDRLNVEVQEEFALLLGTLGTLDMLDTKHVRLPPGVVYLGSLLSSEQWRAGGTEVSGLIVAGSEALWLGPNSIDSSSAVRMFVSRFRDPFRLSAYGGAVADPVDVAVGGDVLDLDYLSIIADCRSMAPVAAIDLTSMSVVGRINPGPDIRGATGRLGIAEVLSREEVQGTTARAHLATGATAHPNVKALDPFSSNHQFVAGVAGVAESASEAEAKCLAEGMERFLSGTIGREEVVHAPADALPGEWLSPDSVIAYSDPQRRRHGLRQFECDWPEWWAKASRGGDPVHLPAALVYCPFVSLPNWLLPSATSSSGVAAHFDRDEARSRAWLEAVERDAFQRLRFGAPNNPPLRAAVSSLPQGAEPFLQLLTNRSDVSTLVLKSPSEVPVVLVRAENDEGVALGMSAAMDPAVALRKALSETYAQVVRPFHHPISPEEVVGPGDHAALYANPEWRRHLDWMLCDRESDWGECFNTDQKPVSLPDHAIVFEYGGLSVRGIHVVRVIDPDLIPLTFGYDSDPLGRPDVRAMLTSSGVDPDGDPVWPHPFA